MGEIDGVKGVDRYLPHLLGHEEVARVLEVGPGVSQVQSGDTVVLLAPWCKIQQVPTYRWRGQVLNMAGFCSRHSVVSENRCTKVPADTDPEVASLFGCAVTTGFGVIENNARLKMGESVVVFGAGGVGLNIVQAASLVSASQIIAVDRYDSRLRLAKQFGASHCVNSVYEDPEIAIKRSLNGQDLDVFIDNTVCRLF